MSLNNKDRFEIDMSNRIRLCDNLPALNECENGKIIYVRKADAVYMKTDNKWTRIGGEGVITKNAEIISNQAINNYYTTNQTVINGGSSVSPAGLSLTYNMNVQGTSYLTLGDNYGTQFISMKNIIYFDKIDKIKCYFTVTNDTIIESFVETLTVTSGSTPITVAKDNLLEYAVKFDTDKKILFRLTEMNSTLSVVRSRELKGTNAINDTLYTALSGGGILLILNIQIYVS